jgi:hypothetical protein
MDSKRTKTIARLKKTIGKTDKEIAKTEKQVNDPGNSPQEKAKYESFLAELKGVKTDTESLLARLTKSTGGGRTRRRGGRRMRKTQRCF